VLVGALLSWLTVCTITGADPRFAWLGTPERHAGLLLWVICAAMLWCAVSLTAVADGLVLAGVGLVPVLVFDSFGHPLVAVGTSRLTGTFGSAAYLAAACTLIAPVAFGVALDGNAIRWRRVAAAVAAMAATFGIVGSGTRGAWLATLVVGGSCVWTWRRKRQTWLGIAGVVAMVVLAALVTPVGQRAGNVADRGAGGGVSRVDEWRVALRTIGEHPLVGAGPEGYRIVFRDGVDAGYERAHGRDPQPDRAHNAVLDMAAIGGIPGAAMYIALLVALGLAVFRRTRSPVRADLRSAGTSTTMVGAIVALVAYAAQQQFLFPLAEVDPVTWLLLGAVAFPTRPQAPDAVRSHGAIPWHRLAAAAAVPLALGAAWWGSRDVLADRAARRAVDAANAGDALGAARDAVALRGDQIRLRLLLARVATDPDEVAAAFDAAARWSPNDPILLIRRAEFFAATDAVAAVGHLRSLIQLDPYNAALHTVLGTALARTNDLAAAEQEWLRALDLAPNADGPRRNLITLYRGQDRDPEADALEISGNR
jgi:O-antigen ligase